MNLDGIKKYAQLEFRLILKGKISLTLFLVRISQEICFLDPEPNFVQLNRYFPTLGFENQGNMSPCFLLVPDFRCGFQTN